VNKAERIEEAELIEMGDASIMDVGAVLDREEIQHYAKEAFEQSGGDVQTAAKILLSNIRQNQTLYIAMADALIPDACYEAVSKICRAKRKRIWAAPNHSTSTPGERIRTAAEGLLNFPIRGGMQLGDATTSEIFDTVEGYTKQVETSLSIVSFLKAVAKKMKPGEIVAEVFTEEELEKLKEKHK